MKTIEVISLSKEALVVVTDPAFSQFHVARRWSADIKQFPHYRLGNYFGWAKFCNEFKIGIENETV